VRPRRRVKRRRGRRALVNFENPPVTTQIYELSGKERACPGSGGERQEIGAEKSWQIEYLPGHFERIQHVRKKYACGPCEACGEKPQMAVAARGGVADRARGGRFIARPVRGGKTGERIFCAGPSNLAPDAIRPAVGRTAAETAALEGATAAQASHGGGGQLHARPVDGTECFLFGRGRAQRQQRELCRMRHKTRNADFRIMPTFESRIREHGCPDNMQSA